MTTTDRLGIPIPEESGQNDVPLDLSEALEVVDSKAAMWSQGNYSARPAAGIPGRFYWAADYKLSYYDDGSQWHEVTRSSAWISWTPTFQAIDGGGNNRGDVSVSVSNLE